MMKCRDFHRMLADWVRGRLQRESDELMTQHAASCRSCAEEAQLERSLRTSFETVAPITRTPDLWERIEARVETTRRPRFAFPFQRTVALSGALGAGLLFAFLALPGRIPPVNQDIKLAGSPGSDQAEVGVLDKFNAIRMTEVGQASFDAETPNSGDAAHLLLVGGPGR